MSDALVIFDCDGVLVDSEVISCQIASVEFSKLGFQISSEDYMSAFAGKSRTAVMAHVEHTTGNRLPDDFSEYLERLILDAFSERLKSIDGVISVLDAAPFKCIASSSSLNRINHSLSVTGLATHFKPAEIFSATMVDQGKPSPDLFLFAACQMGFRPETCIVIEDSLFGVKAAKAANMTCLGFTGGGHILNPQHAEALLLNGAGAVFSKMRQLLKHLCEMLVI